MRTFFYRTKKENCAAGCRWCTCPQRYLAALQKIRALRNIETLGHGPSCCSSVGIKLPKTGDLVILYAEDPEDLDAMVATREFFEGMKKILVVADPAGGDDRKYHLLEPRYITQAGRNMAELEAVIDKMAGSIQ